MEKKSQVLQIQNIKIKIYFSKFNPVSMNILVNFLSPTQGVFYFFKQHIYKQIKNKTKNTVNYNSNYPQSVLLIVKNKLILFQCVITQANACIVSRIIKIITKIYEKYFFLSPVYIILPCFVNKIKKNEFQVLQTRVKRWFNDSLKAALFIAKS